MRYITIYLYVNYIYIIIYIYIYIYHYIYIYICIYIPLFCIILYYYSGKPNSEGKQRLCIHTFKMCASTWNLIFAHIFKVVTLYMFQFVNQELSTT